MTQKIHSAARGLASLGRNGDSTLVHMSPREVQGLQNLAKRHGTSLTINPKTGLPEAFSLDKLLPTLGGLALGIVAPELVIPAAVAAGGIKKAEGGTWGEALSTGLQVYGGAGLGQGLATAGAASAPTESLASQTVAEAAPEATAQVTSNLAANPAVESTVAPDLTSAATNNANFVGYQEGQVAPSLAAGDPGVAANGMGFNASGTPQGFSWDEGINPQTGQLTSDTAQRLASAPGTPQAITTPQTQEQLAASLKPENLAKTEQGIQDLSASQRGQYALQGIKHPGAVYDSMNMGEVMGVGSGLMQGFKEEPKPKDEHRPVYYIPKEGGPALFEQGQINPNIAAKGYIPTGEQAFTGQKFNEGVYSYNPEKYEPVDWDKITKPMKKGGLASLARYDDGGAVPQSKGQQILASNQPLPQAPQGDQNMAAANQYFANQFANTAVPPSTLNTPNPQADWMAGFNESLRPSTAGPTLSTSGVDLNQYAPKEVKKTGKAGMLSDAVNNAIGSATADHNYSNSLLPANTLSQIMGANTTGSKWGMAAGGLADSYAAGGKLLRGPGDGMSDSIPAVIGGKKPQRAALADGEFVVPADVVSHLGNGSTEAGSRKLYAMMDKIRKARTGKKKQAPAVKAERYMPK